MAVCQQTRRYSTCLRDVAYLNYMLCNLRMCRSCTVIHMDLRQADSIIEWRLIYLVTYLLKHQWARRLRT